MNTNQESTQQSINKFLTEEFLGKPECDRIGGCLKINCGPTVSCKCDNQFYENLFTPEGFFILWEKAQEQEWWLSKPFFHWLLYNRTDLMLDKYKVDMNKFINPQTFPVLLAEFIGWKEGE